MSHGLLGIIFWLFLPLSLFFNSGRDANDSHEHFQPHVYTHTHTPTESVLTRLSVPEAHPFAFCERKVCYVKTYVRFSYLISTLWNQGSDTASELGPGTSLRRGWSEKHGGPVEQREREKWSVKSITELSNLIQFKPQTSWRLRWLTYFPKPAK